MNKRTFIIISTTIVVGLMLFYGRNVFATYVSEEETGSIYNPETISIYEMSQQQNIVASDGEANDHMGYGVAASGDTAIVGAYLDDDRGIDAGSAYIFVQDGKGWSEQSKLLANDGSAGSFFGYSVAISGNTAVVGAYRESTLGAEVGAAYVFVRNDCGWVQEAKLTANDGATGDRLGVSVAISGDTIVVGAYRDDDKGTDSGSAYIFVREDGNWTQQAKINATDGSSLDTFGRTVAISGDTVLIGVMYDDDNGNNSGSAYIYERTGTTWSQQTKLLADDGATLDQFGMNVSIDGNSLIVGADGVDDIADYAGSAYVFIRDSGGWSQQAKLLADDGGTGDRFGLAVSIHDDIAVVGSPFNDELGTDSGAAYLFERNGSVWSLHSKLTASDGEAGDFLRHIAFAQNAILVGADGDDINGIDSGSVYSFDHPVFTQTIIYDPSTGLLPDEGSSIMITQLCIPDVFVEKSVSHATALPGQPVTYTLNFGNNGSDIAFNTMITDALPGTIQNPGIFSSGSIITQTGSNPLAWQVQDLAPGESGIITITGVISPDLETGMTLLNTVEISNSLDFTLTNNVATAVSQIIIPEISFSQSGYTVDESAGSLTVTAVLSPAQPFMDVVVPYQTEAGTAVAGEDYTPVTGTLTFPAGISNTSFTIPILNDDVVETNEVFSATIADAVHGQIHNPTLSITILDDDHLPEDSFVYLPLIMNPPALPESEFPIFIGEFISARPVTIQGEVFFSTTVDIPETIPGTGRFFLSAHPEQLNPVVVDDELAILLNGNDVFVYTFSELGGSPQSAIVEVPRSVMAALAGQKVVINYRDIYSHSVSASQIWLQHVP